jgi:adenosylmethionine-8-amino-7-oxononanoate aminotransferase
VRASQGDAGYRLLLQGYSKGLTGGSLPLAVTLCPFSTRIIRPQPNLLPFQFLYGKPDRLRGGGCKPGDLRKEPVLERVAAISRLHSLGLDRFRDDRRFTNVRQIGSIAALDLASRETGYFAAIGPRLYRDFLSRNLLVRPLGNTI